MELSSYSKFLFFLLFIIIIFYYNNAIINNNMSYYLKFLFMNETSLLESVGLGKAGYIKNANYFIKLAENIGYTQINDNTNRSNSTDSVYFMLKSPDGIIFQCRSSDHMKHNISNVNDVDLYIVSKDFNEELCKNKILEIKKLNKILQKQIKYTVDRMDISFIKEYILLSKEHKLSGLKMIDLCKKHNITRTNMIIIPYIWFKKKLKEKVIQFLEAYPEYQKYKDDIGILSWNENDNYLEKW